MAIGSSKEIANFVEGNPARPREKTSFRVKLSELFPEHKTAPLEDVFGIRVVGKKRIDVPKELCSVASEFPQKFFVKVVVNVVRLSGGRHDSAFRQNCL